MEIPGHISAEINTMGVAPTNGRFGARGHWPALRLAD